MFARFQAASMCFPYDNMIVHGIPFEIETFRLNEKDQNRSRGRMAGKDHNAHEQMNVKSTSDHVTIKPTTTN